MTNIQSLIVSINLLLALIANLISYMENFLGTMNEEEKYAKAFIFNYKHFSKGFFANLNKYKNLLETMLIKLKIMSSHKIFCCESYQEKLDKIQQWVTENLKWAVDCIIFSRFGIESDNKFLNKEYNLNLPLAINIKAIADSKNSGDEWNDVSPSIPHFDFQLAPADLPGVIELLGVPTKSYEIDKVKYYSFMDLDKLWRAEWRVEDEAKR